MEQQQQPRCWPEVVAGTDRASQEQEKSSGTTGALRLLEKQQGSSKVSLRQTGKKLISGLASSSEQSHLG